jgi:tRNA A37 methylthiotransferase MiaB
MYNSVALVALPRQDLIRPPGALPILASICEQAQIDYSVWDFNLWLKKNCNEKLWYPIDINWMKIDSTLEVNKPWFLHFKEMLEQYVDLLVASNPDLICISVFTDHSAHCAWEMIHEIRKKTNAKILIGGTGVTAKMPLTQFMPMCKVLLEEKLIDFYIYGEGEINLLRVLQHDLDHPGINNLDAVQIEDLNQLPCPSYAKISPNDYLYINEPSITVNNSRGCVRACTYCDVAHYWPKFRFKDGTKVANELFDIWKETGVKSFEFSDSLINGSIKEFKKLNQRLIELRHNHPEFKINYKGQFICRAAVQFKEQDYKHMAEAGCDYIYVGVETFSESVRMSMAKKFDNSALDFHLKMTAKYGIRNVFLMLVGYPTETLDDHKFNLDTLKRYQHYAQAGVIEMITFGFTASILDNTPLFHMQEQLEIVPEFDDFKNISNWVSLKNPTLTYKERVRRWVDLTESANDLGYNQTRIPSLVERLRQSLEVTATKKLNPIFEIKSI